MRRYRAFGLVTAVLLACRRRPVRAVSTGPTARRPPVRPPTPGAGRAGDRGHRSRAERFLRRRGTPARPEPGWRPRPAGDRLVPGPGPVGRATGGVRAPAAGRFPVVLFSHGLGGRPADYERLLAGWAAAGFVVAAPAYPHTSRGAADYNVLDVLNQPADASYVLTQVLALNGRAGDPLRGQLATDRVAAAGHSAGGMTTVGLFTTARDERLDAGIVFAGSALGVGTAFAGATAPQLFVHGERDDVVVVRVRQGGVRRGALAEGDAQPARRATTAGRCCSAETRPSRVVADSTAEFLRWTLYGDPAAKSRLPPTPPRAVSPPSTTDSDLPAARPGRGPPVAGPRRGARTRDRAPGGAGRRRTAGAGRSTQHGLQGVRPEIGVPLPAQPRLGRRGR